MSLRHFNSIQTSLANPWGALPMTTLFRVSRDGDLSDMARRVARRDRAERIVNRLLPLERAVPHGFYDPRGFADSCARNAIAQAERKRMMVEIGARLTASDAARQALVAADMPY